MKNIDCSSIDSVVCPYCGFVDSDDDDKQYCTEEGESITNECSQCGKEFTVTLTGWSLYWLSEKGTNG